MVQVISQTVRAVLKLVQAISNTVQAILKMVTALYSPHSAKIKGKSYLIFKGISQEILFEYEKQNTYNAVCREKSRKKCGQAVSRREEEEKRRKGVV